MSDAEMIEPTRTPGRRLAAMGVLCAVLGVAAYAAQIAAGRLFIPWYLPASAILGAILVAIAYRQKRGRGRAVALAAVLLLAGAEGLFLFATRLPPYTGPMVVGKPFPAFKTTRADGSAFTDRDLRGKQTTIVAFFRGRW